MFRRDPLLVTLRQIGELLGWREQEWRALLPLTRTALRYGGVIGVARGGQRRLFSVGGVPTEGVFELASVTKPFTSALAAALVSQGLLGWDSKLAGLSGPLRGLPAHFTARSLATHTAGLPFHPARVAVTTFTHFNDPYSGMTPAAVLSSARRWSKSARVPTFAYSNLGVGVLALALAWAAEKQLSVEGFDAALCKHVTGPLGLPSVTLDPPAGQLVSPRGLLGGSDPTAFGSLVGAGGLYGATSDLLSFALAHQNGQAGLHWQEASTPKGLTPPRAAVAPGWFITAGRDTRGPVVWHDGVARGTRTAIGFSADSALVILARGGLPVLGLRAGVPLLLLRLLGGNVQPIGT